MFKLKDVESVLKKLQEDKYFAFCNEAHLQMSFINACYSKKYNEFFEFIPEYPIEIKRQWYKKDNSGRKITKYYKQTVERTETGFADLLIVDKNNQDKTIIEFKYLTVNRDDLKSEKNIILENPCPFVKKYEPSRMLAHDQRRFDCWSDIERIEKLVKKSNFSNGYVIVITNDDKYWNSAGTHAMLSLKQGDYKPETKEWTCCEEDLLGKSDSF